MRRLLPALLLAAAACAHAEAPPPLPCAPGDRECLARLLKTHPIRRLASWQAALARPLAERIAVAPPAAIGFLTLDNLLNGYPERPRAPELHPRFIEEVQAAIADLPQAVNLLFADRLAGILLVADLGGTGYTDVVLDAAGHPVAGFIVLDAGVLQRLTANAWATWKENTPFRPDPDWTLEARIQPREHDNRRNAIQYILLHELGHVLSIGGAVHPPWDVAPKAVQAPDAYEFFALSWRVDAEQDRYVSLFDAAWPKRSEVSYYFGARLDGAEMADAYTALASTNFPTLYAATRPGDDFAESFASYVHVVLMQRPWEIRIARRGEAVQVFGPCWDAPRCAGKRRVLERLIAR